MKFIAGVVFDLEGTVVDVEPAHHQAHIFAAKVIGVDLTMEQCLDGKTVPHFIGGPDRAIAQEIAGLVLEQNSQQLSDSVEMFLENDRAMYEKLLGEMPVEPRRGFLERLERLRFMHLPIAIGSSTPRRQAEVLLGRSGLLQHLNWNRIVLGEKIKDGKPVPDVWLETARRLGVPPDSQLVFEDSPRGIAGAMQVGADCVGMPVYNTPGVITPLLSAGARRIFMDWREMNIYELIENLNEERDKV